MNEPSREVYSAHFSEGLRSVIRRAPSPGFMGAIKGLGRIHDHGRGLARTPNDPRALSVTEPSSNRRASSRLRFRSKPSPSRPATAETWSLSGRRSTNSLGQVASAFRDGDGDAHERADHWAHD